MMFLTIQFAGMSRGRRILVTGNRTDQDFHDALREVVNIGYQEHWLPRTLATKKLRSRLADRETGGTSVNDLRV
jgi:hypothetical protein